MASVIVAPSAGIKNTSGNAFGMDRLPDEINDLKIRDDKVSKI